MTQQQIIELLSQVSLETIAKRIELSHNTTILEPQIAEVELTDEKALEQYLLEQYPGPFALKDIKVDTSTKRIKWKFYSLKPVWRPKKDCSYVLFNGLYSETPNTVIKKYGREEVCDGEYFIKEEYAQDSSMELSDNIPGIRISWV